MDANGTRYHLLLGRNDWATCLDHAGRPLDSAWAASPVEHNDSDLEWRTATNELTLQSIIFQFDTSPFDDRLSLDRRRGAARDKYDNWYWIADSGTELKVWSSGSRRSGHFWAPGDGQECDPSQTFGAFGPAAPPPAVAPLPLSGLAITEDHYLVVGVLEPKGLLIFDLFATGAPRQLLWPANVDFAPFDLAPRPGGGVWILDRVNRRYWGLDRKLAVVRRDTAHETVAADEFQPVTGGLRQLAARPFPVAMTLGAASPISAHDPIAIDAMPDGTVLILDNQAGASFSRLLRYRWETPVGEVSLAAVQDVVDAQTRASFKLIGYDLAFVPAPAGAQAGKLGQAFVAAFNGNQVYAFDVFDGPTGLQIQALADYYPMRLFGGKAIVTAGTQVYYDFGETWLPLTPQKRPRYVPQASFTTPWLDGKQPECVWHRLMLDGCLPAGCEVMIESRACNDVGQRERAAWQLEPTPMRRDLGSELPFVPPPANAEAGTWELLFQSATGRYLQLRVTLNGNGRSTPRLRALRAYYPRFSYLEHYLPAVYREDADSAWFLDRFLANIEGSATALEDKIANVQMLFDVRGAPAGVLDWLASWLGIVLDPAWDDTRRRLFIENAMSFFQYRGTVRGILIALHMAFDTCLDQAVFTQPLVFSGNQHLKDRRLTAFRVLEKFRTRPLPRRVPPAAVSAVGPRTVMLAQRWTPLAGRAPLLQAWQQHAPAASEFSTTDPGGAESAAWRAFTRTRLGFVPDADPTNDAPLWQAFLASRYRTISALNSAYARLAAGAYQAFSEVPLPALLPNDGAALLDWYEFVGQVLPTQRVAHRFTVLLPATQYLSEAERQTRMDIARRVVDLEKPAHTMFDVKFYWAMFCVGEAQLGQDTLIDLGSRAPDLMPAFMLNRDFLAQGYLDQTQLQKEAHGRLALDRDRLGGQASTQQHN